jgi:hypothetical protein
MEMDITMYPSAMKIDILPCLSHLGGVTAAPHGYIVSGHGCTRRYDEIVAHIPNHTKCIDDVCSGMTQ